MVLKHKVPLCDEFPVQWKACGLLQGCLYWNYMCSCGTTWEFQTWQKGGNKKEVKGFIGSFFAVFGNTLVLTGFRLWVHIEIHIKGLSVWSMSHGITTSGGGGGGVSWLTGPGHWMVLRTSLHSYINRIRTSNWGLLASFGIQEGEPKRLWRDLNFLQKCVLRMENSNEGYWRRFNQLKNDLNPQIHMSIKRRTTVNLRGV